jgi:cyclic beta-1,2-glucan synthetase
MRSLATKDHSRWIPFWRTRFLKRATGDSPTDELPLRAELYNVDQLERHAKAIATTHELAKGKSPDKLLPRLSENEKVLLNAYALIGLAAERNRRIAPAAEWLLDNFYLIEEQIRSTRRLLPRSYSGELPRLANGACANFPRVYGIARELILHTDGRVDPISLTAFISAYQSVVPLKLGELWALPLMLRLALIENLRRVAARLASGRRDRDCAADWAERMIKTVEQSPTDLVLILADMARENPPLSGAFIAELTRHLQGQNPNFAFAWMNPQCDTPPISARLLTQLSWTAFLISRPTSLTAGVRCQKSQARMKLDW